MSIELAYWRMVVVFVCLSIWIVGLAFGVILLATTPFQAPMRRWQVVLLFFTIALFVVFLWLGAAVVLNRPPGWVPEVWR